MKYKNIKVTDINPVVYLGAEFEGENWKINQNIFKDKIKDIKFEYKFWFECPIDDMICLQVDYDDEFEPLPKEDTINMIFSVINQLLTVFDDKSVKINLHLDNYIDSVGNSVDMSIEEFTEYLKEEIK